MSGTTTVTIRASVSFYLEEIARTHTPGTTRTYRNAMRRFTDALQARGIDPELAEAFQASEDWLIAFCQTLERVASSTRNVYLTAVIGWYKFLKARGLAPVSIRRVRSLADPYFRPVQRSPQPFSYYDVSRVVSYAIKLAAAQAPDEQARLRSLRDRALIVTLADTNLKLSTICSLRRGDIDWKSNSFVLTDKEGQSVIAGFSPRVSDALRDYLEARSSLDDAANRSQASLPLFARHNRNAGQQVLPISSRSVQNIVTQRAREALGSGYDGTITPRTFRHFFVVSILHSLALLHPKIVDKCQLLFENGLYDEAIFNAMKVVEEEIRSITSSDPTDIGVSLITKVMRTEPPLIEFRPIQAEQESAYFLFRGAIGSFKNPLSHRFLQTSDPVKTFECLALASLLMRMLDEVSYLGADSASC